MVIASPLNKNEKGYAIDIIGNDINPGCVKLHLMPKIKHGVLLN
jgi:hypothetical protein